VLLGTNIGVGILVGEYVGGYLSDLTGRRNTLVAAAIVEGLFIWPIAHTTEFWWLLLWNFLFALGMGMLWPATRCICTRSRLPAPGRSWRCAPRSWRR